MIFQQELETFKLSFTTLKNFLLVSRTIIFFESQKWIENFNNKNIKIVLMVKVITLLYIFEFEFQKFIVTIKWKLSCFYIDSKLLKNISRVKILSSFKRMENPQAISYTMIYFWGQRRNCNFNCFKHPPNTFKFNQKRCH